MREGLGKREAGGGGTVVVGAPYFCHSKSNSVVLKMFLDVWVYELVDCDIVSIKIHQIKFTNHIYIYLDLDGKDKNQIELSTTKFSTFLSVNQTEPSRLMLFEL